MYLNCKRALKGSHIGFCFVELWTGGPKVSFCWELPEVLENNGDANQRFASHKENIELWGSSPQLIKYM
jgi:hypothetical protein